MLRQKLVVGLFLLSILSAHTRYAHMTNLMTDGINAKLLGMSKVVSDDCAQLIFFKVYTNKTADNAVHFLDHCKLYFPFYISYVLTDNGAEFTDRFTSRKNKPSGNHSFG